MADLKGMTGKIARVDLTSGTVTVIEPEEEIYKKFLGGSALGAYFLIKEGMADPAIDPLSPENLFQLMIGPVTGAAPNARSTVSCKGAYNTYCASMAGSKAAAELKMAGWDGIQVVGKAAKPVYLAVLDDVIEIRDASHVWGKGVEEAEMILKSEVTAELETRESMLVDAELTPEWAALHPISQKGFGAKRLAEVWLIGQGGENQVWYASVNTEGARAHGRHGGGAVMGSKNLKAIVVRGTKGHKLADKKKFLELVLTIQKSERGDFFWRKYGTAGIGSNTANNEDSFPVRNWQWNAWSDPVNVRAVDGPFMDAASFVRKMSCPGCNMHCLYTTEITSDDDMMNGTITDMPDWEAMGMIGGNLGFFEEKGKDPSQPYTGTVLDQVENLAKLQYTTMIHDDYGLDYIEGGGNIALLMELVQRGFITKDDLDGIDLQWGDVHAVDEIVKKIVYREGIGDKLANGTYETAKYFAELKGKPEIMNYHVTTHRYGQPAHDVRGLDKDALEYVTVNNASNHTGGGGGGFGKKDYAAAAAGQNGTCVSNSLVTCIFPGGHWAASQLDLIMAATGWTGLTAEDLDKVGAREYALSRLLDVHTQELTDPKEQWDKLVPERWFVDPLPNGSDKGGLAYDGNRDELFNVALPAYWKARGWTEDKGIPTEETLKALGIDDIALDIAKAHL